MLAVLLATAACETLLDVDSDQVVFPDEHRLNDPEEIRYPMIGILSRLEKLADRYVLLGELRGDLMEVTENARPALKEIYEFNISRENPYNRIEDYYEVINNCNYLIRTVDTSIVLGAEKVMLREFAEAKAIRAWTYVQIALNYGTATYAVDPVHGYEEPILEVPEAEQPWPEYSMDELAPLLIADLEPWKDIELPEASNFGEDIYSSILYFPVRFLLGELYLWTGEYEKAATEFNRLIRNETYTVDEYYQSTWDVINGVFVEPNPEWYSIFSLDYNPYEQITMIAGSAEFGEGSFLDSVTLYQYEVAPSSVSKSNWESQTYYHNASAVNQGDLRALGSYFEAGLTETSHFILSLPALFESGIVGKYINMSTTTSKAIYIYRSGLLYLRYAEAVNRAGKPNLAFAVLKNGMNRRTFEIDTLVPPQEKYYSPADSTLFPYMNFSDPVFDDNIGVHSRGCGNVHLASDYRIPALSSLEDSILYVEDLIVLELALETAFEGNRFHDLMRIAERRDAPEYLADRVSEKYPGGMQEEIRARLLNPESWYLPE